jgi:hypothetical protein
MPIKARTMKWMKSQKQSERNMAFLNQWDCMNLISIRSDKEISPTRSSCHSGVDKMFSETRLTIKSQFGFQFN